VPTEGVFRRFSARVKLDPAQDVQGSAQVSIDIESFDLGDNVYNEQVVDVLFNESIQKPKSKRTTTW